jgi:HrpA-like RNA helicase
MPWSHEQRNAFNITTKRQKKEKKSIHSILILLRGNEEIERITQWL